MSKQKPPGNREWFLGGFVLSCEAGSITYRKCSRMSPEYEPLTVKDLLLLLPLEDQQAGLDRVPQHTLSHPMKDYEWGTMYLYWRDFILWAYLGYSVQGGGDPEWGQARDDALNKLPI